VKGLCGSEELAKRQDQEAINFVREARLGVPFLFSKGNHDVTGDGAADAYRQIFHPFLNEEVRKLSPNTGGLRNASYSVEHGDALFAFFDAYDRESLDWLDALAARRTARHFFLVVHPPVVPYGARSTWHLYSNSRQRAQRDKLLDLLGRQEAFVLTGLRGDQHRAGAGPSRDLPGRQPGSVARA
jgi:hypothetical protein